MNVENLIDWVQQNPFAVLATIIFIINCVVLVFNEGAKRFNQSGWVPLISVIFVIVTILVAISITDYLQLSFAGNVAFIIGLYAWYRGTKRVTYNMRKIEKDHFHDYTEDMV